MLEQGESSNTSRTRISSKNNENQPKKFESSHRTEKNIIVNRYHTIKDETVLSCENGDGFSSKANVSWGSTTKTKKSFDRVLSNPLLSLGDSKTVSDKASVRKTVKEKSTRDIANDKTYPRKTSNEDISNIKTSCDQSKHPSSNTRLETAECTSQKQIQKYINDLLSITKSFKTDGQRNMKKYGYSKVVKSPESTSDVSSLRNALQNDGHRKQQKVDSQKRLSGLPVIKTVPQVPLPPKAVWNKHQIRDIGNAQTEKAMSKKLQKEEPKEKVTTKKLQKVETAENKLPEKPQKVEQEDKVIMKKHQKVELVENELLKKHQKEKKREKETAKKKLQKVDLVALKENHILNPIDQDLLSVAPTSKRAQDTYSPVKNYERIESSMPEQEDSQQNRKAQQTETNQKRAKEANGKTKSKDQNNNLQDSLGNKYKKKNTNKLIKSNSYSNIKSAAAKSDLSPTNSDINYNKSESDKDLKKDGTSKKKKKKKKEPFTSTSNVTKYEYQEKLKDQYAEYLKKTIEQTDSKMKQRVHRRIESDKNKLGAVIPLVHLATNKVEEIPRRLMQELANELLVEHSCVRERKLQMYKDAIQQQRELAAKLTNVMQKVRTNPPDSEGVGTSLREIAAGLKSIKKEQGLDKPLLVSPIPSTSAAPEPLPTSQLVDVTENIHKKDQRSKANNKMKSTDGQPPKAEIKYYKGVRQVPPSTFVARRSQHRISYRPGFGKRKPLKGNILNAVIDNSQSKLHSTMSLVNLMHRVDEALGSDKYSARTEKLVKFFKEELEKDLFYPTDVIVDTKIRNSKATRLLSKNNNTNNKNKIRISECSDVNGFREFLRGTREYDWKKKKNIKHKPTESPWFHDVLPKVEPDDKKNVLKVPEVDPLNDIIDQCVEKELKRCEGVPNVNKAAKHQSFTTEKIQLCYEQSAMEKYSSINDEKTNGVSDLSLKFGLPYTINLNKHLGMTLSATNVSGSNVKAMTAFWNSKLSPPMTPCSPMNEKLLEIQKFTKRKRCSNKEKKNINKKKDQPKDIFNVYLNPQATKQAVLEELKRQVDITVAPMIIKPDDSLTALNFEQEPQTCMEMKHLDLDRNITCNEANQPGKPEDAALDKTDNSSPSPSYIFHVTATKSKSNVDEMLVALKRVQGVLEKFPDFSNSELFIAIEGEQDIKVHLKNEQVMLSDQPTTEMARKFNEPLDNSGRENETKEIEQYDIKLNQSNTNIVVEVIKVDQGEGGSITHDIECPILSDDKEHTENENEETKSNVLVEKSNDCNEQAESINMIAKTDHEDSINNELLTNAISEPNENRQTSSTLSQTVMSFPWEKRIFLSPVTGKLIGYTKRKYIMVEESNNALQEAYVYGEIINSELIIYDKTDQEVIYSLPDSMLLEHRSSDLAQIRNIIKSASVNTIQANRITNLTKRHSVTLAFHVQLIQPGLQTILRSNYLNLNKYIYPTRGSINCDSLGLKYDTFDKSLICYESIYKSMIVHIQKELNECIEKIAGITKINKGLLKLFIKFFTNKYSFSHHFLNEPDDTLNELEIDFSKLQLHMVIKFEKSSRKILKKFNKEIVKISEYELSEEKQPVLTNSEMVKGDKQKNIKTYDIKKITTNPKFSCVCTIVFLWCCSVLFNLLCTVFK